MAEYIDKSALYEKIAQLEELERNRYLDAPSNSPCYSRYMAQLNERTALKHVIADFPFADVAPVRHGRWLFITKGQMTSAWCCSECGRTVVITCDEELRQSKLEKEYPFCHCGAKMDLEE